MADSSTKRIICTIISIFNNIIESRDLKFLRRVINKCPVIILAVNRTARVPGRIKFLVVSIITNKGSKKFGEPWGTKWANIWVVFLHHP